MRAIYTGLMTNKKHLWTMKTINFA